jgi:CBS domain-containing protein
MRLSDILRDKPARLVTLPPTAPVVQAAVLMKLEGVGAILVCDARRRVLGVLSERDLVLGLAALGADVVTLTVGELMSTGGPTASLDDSIRDVMRTMTERRARHVPVLDGEEVAGVVSIGDVLKSRLAEKIQENAVLQDIARINHHHA